MRQSDVYHWRLASSSCGPAEPALLRIGRSFALKRLAPGEFIGTKRGALFHDCSTLGGNSGSPLVDMTTGAVVGLHRDGSFLARNEAVGIEARGDFVRV